MTTISLSEKYIFQYFGSVYGHRGDSYQRNRRVLQIDLNAQKRTISGEVQGGETRPYKVSVRLDDGGSKIEYSDCSCPMGGYCKHSAALLLDAIRTGKFNQYTFQLSGPVVAESEVTAPPDDDRFFSGKRQTTTAAKSTSKPSPQVINWIASLSSSLFEESKTQPAAATNDTIVYLLDVRSNYERLTLTVGRARKLKTGGWGKLFNANLERIAVQNAGYVTDEDCEIARLFLAGKNEMSWYAHRYFPETPELSQIILARMLATKRCFWKELGDIPLRFAGSKKAMLHWQTREDGKQLLRVSSGCESDLSVIAGGGWYVDLPDYALGPLELPLPAKAVHSILNAPAVEPFEAQAVSQELSKMGSVIPLPRENFTVETVTVAPIACLTLSVEDASRYYLAGRLYGFGEQIGFARLSFRYGQAQFEHVGQTECRTVEGSKITIHKKDLEAQSLRAKELERYGLQRIPQTSERAELAFGFREGEASDWLQFSQEAVPQLRQQGWQIEFEKSFQFQVVVPEEQWQADATEGSDFWFSLDLGITVDGKRVPLLPIIHEALKRISGKDPLMELEQLNCAGTFYAPLPDGRYAALPFDRVRAIVETLVELFDKGSPVSQIAELSLPQMFELTKTFEGKSAKHSDHWAIGGRLRELLDKVKRFNGLAKIIPPSSFKAILRGYQQDGLSWLNFLREFQLGGILADDMGLGKTVQTLAHIAYEKSAKRLNKPFLVVCPTSVLPNWISEIEKFTPSLTTTALFGPERASQFGKIGGSDIVVTTYPLVSRDADILIAQQWKALILDEAQMIKNPNTQVAQAVGKLRSDYRVCLTGTPIENHLGELWSQYNFLMPGFLKDLPTFTRTFRTPIEKQKNVAAQKVLSARVRPFLLRRTKELVAAELPEKTIIIKRIELEGAQRDLYETVRLAMYEKVKEALSSKGLAKSQIIILDALLKLRQVCCDPRLLSMSAAKKVQSTAKLDLLTSMLEELVAEGKRVLLFSQFTSMLDLIIPELEKRQIGFVEIRGDTKYRGTPVRLFQNGDVPLFLLSLKAGGFGLNLTAADTVIHYDPWWNPAVENQATDRAHRIGQKQSVFVFKLIASGTIEERMLQLQDRKKAIAEGMYDADNALPFKLTAEDLESLFSPLR